MNHSWIATPASSNRSRRTAIPVTSAPTRIGGAANPSARRWAPREAWPRPGKRSERNAATKAERRRGRISCADSIAGRILGPDVDRARVDRRRCRHPADHPTTSRGPMFRPVPARPDLIAMEHEILAFWRERGTFAKLQAQNADGPHWSFLDGPITANNPMGVHHAWGRTYKDLYQRFHAMLGEAQRWQNGFDGQGLWVEVEVEKELGFQTKRDIEAFGIAEFVERCKERVRRFAGIQTEQSIRLGYWVDWDHSYHTMSDENNYTIWHFLKKCWERGLIYKGHDVMPWCPRCATGLSEHGIVTEGYKEITPPGVFVRLPLREHPGRSLLVWTK